MDKTVQEIVRQAETNLTSGDIKLGKYVDFSLYETTERIFAYLNSRFTNGSTDSLGREKPFFNIVTAAVNIWYRATDIDRKDIQVLPDKGNMSNVAAAFIATMLLHEWMKKTQFGVFLNEWGRVLAQYGSAVVKFVEQDGQLIPSVIPWNRIIVDPIDFDAIPRIEKFYKTPSQLKNMATKGHPDYAGYDLDTVNSLIENTSQTRETLNREEMDNQSGFIEIYEVHGQMSVATLKKAQNKECTDEDYNTFTQQMHVISFTKSKEKQGEYDDYTLYAGKEKNDPYMITHLIKEDGRTLSIGAVEYLFDAQWMQNHTIKAWKDQMDLTSKIIFQTADQSLLGKNILTNLETGDIIYHAPNAPVTQFPNVGHDVQSLQAFSNQWKLLAQEVTSTPDALRGNTLPSGTPYSLGAYLGTQSLSLFEVMTENKAHDLEAMLRRFVIPFLKEKALKNKDEIVAMLDDASIKKIDAMYVPNKAAKNFNQKVKESLLKGQLPEGISFEGEMQDLQAGLSMMGNQRAFSPEDVNWSEVLKDLEWKLDIAITNEQADKQAVLGSLTTILQTLATNPAVLQDPNARTIFNKILTYTNVASPVELASMSQQQSVQAPMALPQNSG